jgi:type VI secretion system protein ImpG
VIQVKAVNNQSVSQIGWETLRFFLNGPHQHVFHLYELIFNNVCHVEIESTNKKGQTQVIPLARDDVQSVGFGPDDVMLPYPRRSFPGYFFLLEYFCFPEKFLFFDLNGLKQIRDRELGDTLDIWIYLDRSAKTDLVINKDTFCLNAAPVLNLFQRVAEPIRVEQEKTEYQVIPDVRRQEATEVFTVDRVTTSSSSAPGKEFEFKPFYSIRHHLDEEQGQRRVFWHLQRRPSGRKGDDGTEVFLSFADPDFDPVDPGVETLNVYTTCTNRDLPSRLPFGDPTGDFTLETAAPVARITCLMKPTPARRSPLGGALQWRLISHLSLNYMSLVQGGEDALREIFKLYDFDDSPTTRQQINGLVSIQSRQVTKRVGQSFCRGVQVTIEFDEDRFVGAGLYLFASVLERFLGQYVSVNSFSQLVARTVQKKGALKTWPPRNGDRVLL